MEIPFEAPGEWLRCALHAHTSNSDGEASPAELVRHYEAAGFDVLAVTDHWVRTRAEPRDGLVLLAGTELDARLDGSRTYAHVLALGLEADPLPPPAEEFPGLAETVAWVEAAGGLPFVAHTYWSGLRPEDFEACPGIVGLEVYNAGCELEVGRGLATLHWDEVLERGRPCLGIATDDSHHPGFDSGHAWVWARAPERSSAAVLAALRAGRFYSSTGPELRAVEVGAEEVVVRTSPAASVTLLAGRAKGARVNAGPPLWAHRAEALELDGEGGITAARLERPPRTPYGRVEVRDRAGRTAWTNPLWIR